MSQVPYRQHSSHWGTFQARTVDGKLEIKPFEQDPMPSPLLRNFEASLHHSARLARPLVRKGWLNDGPGPDRRRGHDDYVEMGWDAALDLAAKELRRLGAGSGSVAGGHVFGGSYGWSSAGRFHHAQSQVHRFLNTAFGGYVRSVDSYSSAAGAVILSYVLGDSRVMTRDHPYWQELADSSELVLAFGGLPMRNSNVSNGGISNHCALPSIRAARNRGARFVLISPLRDDLAEEIPCDWYAPYPGTDTALMLGMAWHLHRKGLVDQAYLDRYTVGYERFEVYLLGKTDGTPKTPEWAEAICGIPAQRIEALAERASSSVTLINVTYSLQRAENGEQPVWMALVLSAMLGHMGKPGGGFCYGLSSIGNIGRPPLDIPLPTFSQKTNGVADFIPVARISDLLLRPGETYTYKGEVRRYADIRLVYWAGGNPFHHHQDLSRLTEAFSQPETVIVHDSVATATTRHADIVFPATTTLERDDIGASANDPYIFAMQKIADPFGEARDDYDIFSALAQRIGVGGDFTEGHSVSDWLQRLYEPSRKALEEKGLYAPSFETFWQGGRLDIPTAETPGFVARFHKDPARFPLATGSGKIEIACEAISSNSDCGIQPHPVWIEPEARQNISGDSTAFPLQLVANQPATRLHSQLDFGAYSVESKINGREPVRIHPADAEKRQIMNGDTVKIVSPRGATLAGAIVTDKVRQGVVQLSTGAWYDPVKDASGAVICRAGNPNAVTRDVGASPLSQGCTGQLAMVEVLRVIAEQGALDNTG
ncbi:molybdopterin-dependent oxidoreductase [Brucella intermedia]|uniref:molybdopterin-dependent oxidoreductase n=1 Tax=Brucella intermedia TaxID=94625 RepID=UPI00224B3E56|nr:molybdopterin-dependent oxidoreductase [Brucella intermedia]